MQHNLVKFLSSKILIKVKCFEGGKPELMKHAFQICFYFNIKYLKFAFTGLL